MFLSFLSTVPPHLVTSSEQAKGNSGSTVELVCRVGGDPPPEVYWERAPPGELPIERMIQEENGQVLRIRHATADDQGIYICRAENPVGSVKANLSLSIYCEYNKHMKVVRKTLFSESLLIFFIEFMVIKQKINRFFLL